MSYGHSTVGITILRYQDFNVYGIRGTGRSYGQLYDYLESKHAGAIISVYIDMPWHYIRFKSLEAQISFDYHINTMFFDSIDDRGMQKTSFEDDWPTAAKYSL